GRAPGLPKHPRHRTPGLDRVRNDAERDVVQRAAMPAIEQIQRLAVALGGDAGDERRVGHLGVPGCVARLARTHDLYVGWWRLLRGSAKTRTSFKAGGKRLRVTQRLEGYGRAPRRGAGAVRRRRARQASDGEGLTN